MSNHIFGDKEHFERVCAHLITQGVKHAEVDFDGSGDSGSITEVRLVFEDDRGPEYERKLLDTQLQALVHKDVFNQATIRWVKQVVPAVSSLEDILKDATYQALERTGHDWYNNDGGYGTLALKLDGNKPELVLDIHIRETKTDDYTYELTDGPLTSVDED